jgi:DNA repair exonuclease SbcCD ATPase subunit
MKTLRPLPLLVVLALGAALPCQNSIDVSIQATVLTQFSSGTNPSTPPLVVAILNEPEVGDAVRRIGGDAIDKFEGTGVGGQEPTASSYRFSFTLHLQGKTELPRATQDAMIDAVYAHLCRRLIELDLDRSQHLKERYGELCKQHQQLVFETMELRAKNAQAEAEQSAILQLQADNDRERIAVQLDLATEERANVFLEKSRAEMHARREQLREQKADLDERMQLLEQELREIGGRLAKLTPTTDQDSFRKDSEQLVVLQQQLAKHNRDQQRVTEALADVQEQLSHNLEQLPASSLALQRCRARLEALQERHQELAARAAKADAARKVIDEQQARAERVSIDLEVCRTLLTEVQQKLGRLEPIRCQLLRQ